MTSGPDIILGVSRAADAVKQREATARLERMSRSAATDVASNTAASDAPSDWETELRRAASGSAAPLTAGPPTSQAATVRAAPKASDDSDKKSEVYVQFESVLLQNMVEAMMPEDSQSMFGTGMAGGMWKSMLAEKIAAEIARSGSIGIAKQIAAGPAASSAFVPATPAKSGDA